MSCSTSALLSLFLGLSVAGSSFGQSVEPDDFMSGQNISTAVPDVTLSAPGNGNSDIFAVQNSFVASTGQNVFGYFDGASMSLDAR